MEQIHYTNETTIYVIQPWTSSWRSSRLCRARKSGRTSIWGNCSFGCSFTLLFHDCCYFLWDCNDMPVILKLSYVSYFSWLLYAFKCIRHHLPHAGCVEVAILMAEAIPLASSLAHSTGMFSASYGPSKWMAKQNRRGG